MKSIRFLDRRAGFSLASLGLLLGMVVPSVVPAFVSADTLQSRSIEMSTTAADASGATYVVTFTPSASSFNHVIIDFCSDSPIIAASCATSLGSFDASGVTITSSAIGTVSVDGSSTADHLVIDGTSAHAAASAVTFTLAGVHNPTAVGAFYARIYTYSGTPNYTDASTLGSAIDTGGIALSTENAVGVTAAVRETLTFCVSGANAGPDCGTSGTAVTSPSLVLGEGSAPNQALQATAVSTGTNYAQLSTNANSGAVVNLKSNRTGCGGLVRVGASNCDIIAADSGHSDITAGQARFGVKVGSSTSVSGASTPSGSLAPGSGYSSSAYFLGYVSGDATGVTSPHGSELFDSAGAPVNNKYVPLTFGASISNVTPAGSYSATLNLIATGTY